MATAEKREAVFDLIKSMNKAEKRSFKLYALRQGATQPKFLALFDCLDTLPAYDEQRILKRCPVKKEQLPNLKAHLYAQLLASMRLSGTSHSIPMQIRERLDYARILFDKGLYRLSSRQLEKASALAACYEQHTLQLSVLEFQRQIETVSPSRDMTYSAETLSRHAGQVSHRIATDNELAGLAIRIYALHQKLGYARSQKDLDLIDTYFKPRLESYASRSLSFTERFYYYQAMAWYHYIKHAFTRSYRYAREWVSLFQAHPHMKEVMYDRYLKGYSRLLDGLFLMRKYRHFIQALQNFEQECLETEHLNVHAAMISRHILYTGKLNRCIFEGSFKEGIWLIRSVEDFIRHHAGFLTVHEKMLFNYKFACLHFGSGNYSRCMEYLNRIMETRDPHIRRDLQCYARMLHLIASYEAGIDDRIDYQIRSVFTFLAKMRDMSGINRALLGFLGKLSSVGPDGVKDELQELYRQIKPMENHPYERRIFYYLDLVSWLESKISDRPIGEIVREKFQRSVQE